MKRSTIIFLVCLSLSGCLYQMPDEDRICTLPNVNNPTLTRQQPTQMIPKK